MSTVTPPGDVSSAASQGGSFFSRFGKAIVRFFTWPFRLSFPGKIAFLSFILLSLLAFIVWLIIRSNPKHVALYHVLTWQRITVVLVLLAVIPVVIYFTLKTWLEGEGSPFPDIDSAWKAGVEALRDNGLSLDAMPVFLVMGSPDGAKNAALATASGRQFRVAAVPDAPAPLQWYADAESVFLFLNSIGSISALNALIEKQGFVQSSGPSFAPISDAPTAPIAQPAAAEPAAGGPQSQTGTLTLQAPVSPGGGGAGSAPQPVLGGMAEATQPATAQPPAGTTTAEELKKTPLRGTMMFPPAGSSTATATAAPVQQSVAHSIAPLRSTMSEAAVELPVKEADLQRRRLHYLIRLFARRREPLCPINGAVTLLPFAAIEAGASQAVALERAVRSDIEVIQHGGQVRFPVSAMIVGLEEERGFSELIRRVGRERAAVQRFGRGYDLRGLPSEEEMAAFGAHVVGAFEDWVYSLFREEDSLAHPGNTLLYGLLCKVRSTLKGRLTDILAKGYGYDARRHSEEEAFLFSGCYFAATGSTEDRQAFVRGVFDKLEDEQESVEWTRNAVVSHRSRKRIIGLGAAASAALAIALAAMLILKK